MTLTEGERIGLKKGRAEGRAEGQAEMVKKMRLAGIPEETIQEILKST